MSASLARQTWQKIPARASEKELSFEVPGPIFTRQNSNANLIAARQTVLGLLVLGYLRHARGHTLPLARTLDPGIRPTILTADILAFVLCFHC
jgi:hypothetical protein